MKRLEFTLVLSFVLCSLLFPVSRIRIAEAVGTIYIRADGSIDPPDAPILRDGDLYTLTSNVTTYQDGIGIQRGNIVLDGAGLTLTGDGAMFTRGVYADAANVTIRNVRVESFWCGINVNSNASIVENIMSENWIGIRLLSQGNNVFGNNIPLCRFEGSLSAGIVIHSDNNTVCGNNITNTPYGLLIGSSSHNTITGNVFIHDGLYVDDYYRVTHGNVIEGNVVNGKPLVYLEGVSNRTVSNAGQVVLVNCTEIQVENSNLSDIGYDVGLELCRTNNSRIVNNNIENNRYGTFLYFSSNNSFLHNNFIGNNQHVADYSSTVQAYDDGYPSGGNYWSGYGGVDFHCGIHQNLTGSDGIGDTPFSVRQDNVDHYPYMKPSGWLFSPVSVESNATVTDLTVTGYATFFTASGPEGQTGYVNATMPIGFVSTEIKVFVDSKPIPEPFPIITENGTHRFVYFEFALSTHNVTIEHGTADIATVNVTTDRTVVGQIWTLGPSWYIPMPLRINASWFNKGNLEEAFDATVYLAAAEIGKQTITLVGGSSATVVFTWDLLGISRGNYTIRGYAPPVPGENDTSDNTFDAGFLTITIAGDVNGDGSVDARDVYAVARAYGTTADGPNPVGRQFNANCDINFDNKVDARDYYIVCKLYGNVDS